MPDGELITSIDLPPTETIVVEFVIAQKTL